jgi:hypothetical protein
LGNAHETTGVKPELAKGVTKNERNVLAPPVGWSDGEPDSVGLGSSTGAVESAAGLLESGAAEVLGSLVAGELSAAADGSGTLGEPEPELDSVTTGALESVAEVLGSSRGDASLR